jgi:hypothetical protein
VRIIWHMVFEIPAPSATSWTVKWPLKWITFQTFWVFSSFFDVEVWPEHSLFATEVQPSLKHLYHSRVCVLLMTLSPNASFNISKVSKSVCPNLKQNFTKHVAHENNTLTAGKFAVQARYVFTLIHRAQWLRKLDRSGLWHSPKETHCHTVNQ